MLHLRGRIDYVRDRRPVGREHWDYTKTADGLETVRVVCEIDPASLLRDVIYTIDTSGRPLDVLIRLEMNGVWQGSASYVVRGSRLEAAMWGPGADTLVRSIEVPERFVVITHPVFLDGWQLRAYDWDRGGAQDVFALNCSTRPDGGDLVIRQHQSRLTVLERETIDAAGESRTGLHFQIQGPSEYGPIDVWVDPETNVMLHAEWAGFGEVYELKHLTSLEPASMGGSGRLDGPVANGATGSPA